jgi:hypothetical protein
LNFEPAQQRAAAYERQRNARVSQTETPWSKHDDGNLKRLVRHGRTLADVAVILERTVADVERRLTELGRRMPGANAEMRERDE